METACFCSLRTTCDPVYALVYPTVPDCSYCVVSQCGLVCALVYPTVADCSSYCVVCVCIWSRLCASVSHSDVLLCCVCLYVVPSTR
jgi:hypothetical protein